MTRENKFNLGLLSGMGLLCMFVITNMFIMPWAFYPFEKVGSEAKAIIALEEMDNQWSLNGNEVIYLPTQMCLYSADAYLFTQCFTPPLSRDYFNLKERYLINRATRKLMKNLKIRYNDHSKLEPFLKGVE